MEYNYNNIESQLNEITSDIYDINLDNLEELLNKFETMYLDIYDIVKETKFYGQDNENTLYKEKKEIENKEKEIEELKDRISELESDIDDIKYAINRLANKKHILYKIGVRKFICTTHDEILTECINAKLYCEELSNDIFYDNEITISNDVLEEIKNNLLSFNANIMSGIDEARDSNESMNNGINNHNERIYDLENEISDLYDEIEEKERELEDLKDELEELENKQNN